MSNPPPDDEKPRPVIYPDADSHNANWLRILAQRREQEQKTKDQHKEKLRDGDVQ